MFQHLDQASQMTLNSLHKNHFQEEIKRTENPNELVAVWKNKGLSPATIKKLLQIYKSWHKQEYGIYPEVMPRVQVEAQKPKAWSKEEAKRVLNVAYQLDKEMYEVVLLALHTGMRRGEIFGLLWSDVDLAKKKIFLSKTKSKRPRVVGMTEEVYALLRSKEKNFGLIFRKFDPNPRLKKLCKIAKVKLISFHGIRHSFATIALDSGRLTFRQVADMLGHKNVSTTLDIYWNSGSQEFDYSFIS